MDFRIRLGAVGQSNFTSNASFRGARNVWRMTVDPVTLQATSVERLTTSPGVDAELSVSPDGSKIAFKASADIFAPEHFPSMPVTGASQAPASLSPLLESKPGHSICREMGSD